MFLDFNLPNRYCQNTYFFNRDLKRIYLKIFIKPINDRDSIHGVKKAFRSKNFQVYINSGDVRFIAQIS